MTTNTWAALAVLLAAAAAPASQAAAPVYRLVQPEIPGERAAIGAALNNNGTVAGQLAGRFDSFNNYRLFLWKPETGAKVITEPNFGSFESVTGLDEQDRVVGTVQHLGPAGVSITDLFLLSQGKLRYGAELAPALERALPGNISDAGVIPVNLYGQLMGTQNYLWKVGQKPVRRPKVEFTTSWINGSGLQVGLWNRIYAYKMETDGTLTQLAPLKQSGEALTTANAVNEAGQIVGSSWAQKDRVRSTNATLWQPSGEVVDLGLLPGSLTCVATRINERSEVVGSCSTAAAQVGFYWSSGTGMLTLRDLIDPADPLLASINTLTAVDINDRGDVLANATTVDGLSYVLVLQPQ